MEHERKTKRRTYLWIVLAVLAFFPLIWMLQPSVASPYSTSLQVSDGVLAVDSVHPAGPNRLERFGTDPLGRHVATLLANALPGALGMAFLAGVLRSLLGAGIGRFTQKPRGPAWLWAVGEVLLYRSVFSLPLFRTGTAADHRLLILLLLGAYFLPARSEDTRLRKVGLIIMEQSMRILLLFAVLGLTGLTFGANPYGAIPTAYGPVSFTYPTLTNLVSGIWQVGFSAWWMWGIPVISVLLIIVAVLLAKSSMQDSYERVGLYFTGLGQDFMHFLNPVQTMKELFRFTRHLGKNSLRLFILLVVALIYVWGRTGGDAAPYVPEYNEYAAVEKETAGLQTTDARMDYVEKLLENSRINPIGEEFRIPVEGGRLVAGSRPGVSRIQPLLLIFDVRDDATTFALQIALMQSVLDNAANTWLQQTVVFAFTDRSDLAFRSLLEISGHGFYAILSELAHEPVLVDETLVYPANSWAAAMARDFHYAFEKHGISHELDWLQPPDEIALALTEQGLMGVQIRGGSEESPQATLEALTDAVLRYGTRPRSR